MTWKQIEVCSGLSLWWGVDCGAVQTHLHGICNHTRPVKHGESEFGERVVKVVNVV